MSVRGEFEVVRFSTEGVSDQDSLAAWRDIFGRMIARVDIEPIQERPYHAVATLRALPGLGTISVSCSGAHYRHTKGLTDGDDLALIVSLTHGTIVCQRGRDVVLGVGEAILVTAAEDARVTLLSPGQRFSLRLPFAAMAPLIGNLDAALTRRIPADTEALQLLMSYRSILHEAHALATPEIPSLVVTHVRDLAAIAIGATPDAAARAQGRGVGAARLHAIKANIIESLNGDNLSLAAIAACQRVTPRYVQMLFEAEDTTF